jgi:NAD-specific glutamate dehydrogenase
VQLTKETSTPIEELVVRYFTLDELLGGRAIRAAIHAGDGKIAAADQYAALMAFEEIHRSVLRWWNWNEATWRLEPTDVGKTKLQLEAAMSALVTTLEGGARVTYDMREQDLLQRGFSAEVATALARGPLFREAFPLLATVTGSKLKPDKAAGAFHRVGRELHVDAFDELLAAQVPANSWERRFLVSLEREAATVRQQAAGKLAADPELIERNRERVDRIGDALGTVKKLGGHGLVPLFLILEDYRAVV